jgi:hypothetical protein
MIADPVPTTATSIHLQKADLSDEKQHYHLLSRGERPDPG